MAAIECGITGRIPFDVAPDDAFQVSFDIAEWLDEDTIQTVAYSAKDEEGEANSDVLDSDKHENTNTVLKPWIKGGGVDHKEYAVKCKATMASAQVKSFYVKFTVNEVEG